MHVATLEFQSGTLVVRVEPSPPPRLVEALEGLCVRDERVRGWRAPASKYRELFVVLHRLSRQGEVRLEDAARAYEELPLRLRAERTPREYQREAVEAWTRAGRRGQIILPTGAGKSFVAQLAIRDAGRSALVVVPTLDLLNQWYAGLLAAFEVDEVGLIGGGSHDVRPLTVTTYDSAAIHMERIGNRFGLLVFDEVHHLPGPTYLLSAECAIAPFRLGLTATPERQDGREGLIDEAVGPIVYRREIRDLAGLFLSEYETIPVAVDLDDDERARYEQARETYLGFIRRSGIRFNRPGGWGDFIRASARSREGRRAMQAYREQRRIALTCRAKFRLVERLVAEHAGDRVILFTNDNETVYSLSRRLLVPAITHQTPVRERRETLARFNDGRYPVVVTSRVLNEGVDVPEASVAIVLSGTGSVREHVQRLGRILRPSADKQALLYEVVTRNTMEESVSERRREHDAYR